MKRTFSLILVLMLLFGIVGCNNHADNSNDPESDPIEYEADDGESDIEGENMQTKNRPVLYQINPDKTSLMMSYIIKTPNNKLIVIDGGGVSTSANNKGYLFTTLQNISGSEKPEVEAWFLTHMHEDHVTEFNLIANRANRRVIINSVYFNFPSRSFFEKTETQCVALYDDVRSSYDNIFGKGTFDTIGGKNVRQGDIINIDGVEIEILLTCLDDETETNVNDTSLIFRVKMEKQTILFFGDAGVAEGNRFLSSYDSEYIKSDIVQMAHHGQGGVSEEVYKTVDPKICLWPSPDWVFENVNGNLQTLEVRQWMVDLGVKYHYVSGLKKNQTLSFPVDFNDIEPLDITPYPNYEQ